VLETIYIYIYIPDYELCYNTILFERVGVMRLRG